MAALSRGWSHCQSGLLASHPAWLSCLASGGLGGRGRLVGPGRARRSLETFLEPVAGIRGFSPDGTALALALIDDLAAGNLLADRRRRLG